MRRVSRKRGEQRGNASSRRSNGRKGALMVAAVSRAVLADSILVETLLSLGAQSGPRKHRLLSSNSSKLISSVTHRRRSSSLSTNRLRSISRRSRQPHRMITSTSPLEEGQVPRLLLLHHHHHRRDSLRTRHLRHHRSRHILRLRRHRNALLTPPHRLPRPTPCMAPRLRHPLPHMAPRHHPRIRSTVRRRRRQRSLLPLLTCHRRHHLRNSSRPLACLPRLRSGAARSPTERHHHRSLPSSSTPAKCHRDLHRRLCLDNPPILNTDHNRRPLLCLTNTRHTSSLRRSHLTGLIPSSSNNNSRSRDGSSSNSILHIDEMEHGNA